MKTIRVSKEKDEAAIDMNKEPKISMPEKTSIIIKTKGIKPINEREN